MLFILISLHKLPILIRDIIYLNQSRGTFFPFFLILFNHKFLSDSLINNYYYRKLRVPSLIYFISSPNSFDLARKTEKFISNISILTEITVLND